MNNQKQQVWVHIGAGSFHRAHQAWYLHRLLMKGDNRWSIALGNIRNDAEALLSALEQQNGEYTLETVSPAGECQYERITSIKKVLKWDSELSSLVDQGSAPETGVISFTVTEGGYYLDTEHKLDPKNPDIQADLMGEAKTIYGTLERIIRKRIARKAGSVTLLNCDNLRHNGERFRNGFIAFLALKGDLDLLDWVKNFTTSPNTMVDRITPRPTADIAPRVKETTGFDDKAALMGESFIQWVIEDDFIAGRPALEDVGVEMVDSVLPWEEAKIRILNASHSCIAWAGTLIGQSFIHESTQTSSICEMAWEYVTQDVIPSLSPSPLDLNKYRDVVLDRFRNPYILDTNQRVAADGLSKIPGFITPTLMECYKRGEIPRATAVLPALFFLFMERWHEGDLPYTYQDGILDEHAMHVRFNKIDPLADFARDEALFGPLASQPAFEALLRETVKKLRSWIALQTKDLVASK